MEENGSGVEYRAYKDENDLPQIMNLVDNELSEPYSIFTYRYLIHQWPHLCFTAHVSGECVGTVVCKVDDHKSGIKRGYIAMLVVVKQWRGHGIARELVTRSIQTMKDDGCLEVALEAEVTNISALALYHKLGFIRAKRLHRHYLNGVDAFRLKLRFPRTNITVDGLPSSGSSAAYSREPGSLVHASDWGRHVHQHGEGCRHRH